MTWTRLCAIAGVSGILTGIFWNGPFAIGHYLSMLAVLWVACALVDGARIWRLNR